jgi:colanic acid biosynthesis glycosyl transferase WcaI
VAAEKVARIYNPSKVQIEGLRPRAGRRDGDRRLLVMGNIGHSQGLAEVVRTLESTKALERSDAQLRIAGHGVARDDVAAEIRGDRIQLLGLLPQDELERELDAATLGVVTQRSDVTEFNLPSKLMNYMGHRLPVLAVVRPESETARIVVNSSAGWIADSARLNDLPDTLAEALADPRELERRGAAAGETAEREFSIERIAERSEALLRAAVGA